MLVNNSKLTEASVELNLGALHWPVFCHYTQGLHCRTTSPSRNLPFKKLMPLALEGAAAQHARKPAKSKMRPTILFFAKGRLPRTISSFAPFPSLPHRRSCPPSSHLHCCVLLVSSPCVALSQIWRQCWHRVGTRCVAFVRTQCC